LIVTLIEIALWLLAVFVAIVLGAVLERAYPMRRPPPNTPATVAGYMLLALAVTAAAVAVSLAER
jgi:hypothetical protein